MKILARGSANAIYFGIISLMAAVLIFFPTLLPFMNEPDTPILARLIFYIPAGIIFLLSCFSFINISKKLIQYDALTKKLHIRDSNPFCWKKEIISLSEVEMVALVPWEQKRNPFLFGGIIGAIAGTTKSTSIVLSLKIKQGGTIYFPGVIKLKSVYEDIRTLIEMNAA